MRLTIFYPDYQHSILSLTSSLLHCFGISSPHSGLIQLDRILESKRKNTVLLILDGMGSDALAGLLPSDAFLRRHKAADLSTVYPCTTTAATTTLSTGLSPLEHGWLGWSPWFREFGRVVDIFIDRDSYSGAQITPSPAKLLLPYRDIAEQLAEASRGELGIHRLMPSFADDGCGSLRLMLERAREICRKDGPQLILAYWHEPDTLMHNEGPWSDAVRKEMIDINAMVESFFSQCRDLLLLVSADHGQIVVDREIYLDEIPELNDCLILPPSLETRAVSLFVKAEKRDYFARKFEDILGDCFLLLPREAVFKRGLLGSGLPHHKVDDFIGDFLACATGNSIIRYHTPFNRPRWSFKGHHAGLRSEEMIVPLIVAAD